MTFHCQGTFVTRILFVAKRSRPKEEGGLITSLIDGEKIQNVEEKVEEFENLK